MRGQSSAHSKAQYAPHSTGYCLLQESWCAHTVAYDGDTARKPRLKRQPGHGHDTIEPCNNTHQITQAEKPPPIHVETNSGSPPVNLLAYVSERNSQLNERRRTLRTVGCHGIWRPA